MAVSPDSRFICSSDVDSYFVDKTTGGPLSGGKVYFYEDENRTVLKSVYQLTGSPPNYSFTALPNPIDLSAVGTYNYLNNNIAVYYFPYQGTPDNSDGTLQLYYITVEDSNGLEQLVREAWPPNISEGRTPVINEGSRNFIPNGQFLTHTQIVGTSTPPVISVGGVDIQYIAQGGWSFRRTTGGASIFNNSFTSLTGAVSGLNDFPRNAFNFICSSFSGTDQIRDFCIEWEDTNKFSAGIPEGSQSYTYLLAAESLDSNSYTFDVRLIRNFGTGGTPSSPTDESIGAIVITPSYNYFNINIASIPEAIGSYGTNGDDYILIALRGPNSSFAVQFTDLGFFSGTQQLSVYPTQTDGDMITRSIFGWADIPKYDASTLYLPAILTPKGVQWDYSQIGKYEDWAYIWDYDTHGAVCPDTNVILCNGSAYFTDDYSLLGIPFSRLRDKIVDQLTGIPLYGTGYDYVTSYIATGTSSFNIITNIAGPQSATADGSISTGFAISTLFTGNVSYQINSNIYKNGTIITYDLSTGAVTAANSGTSGFVVNQIINSPSTHAQFEVTVSSLPSAGSYFTFSSIGGGNFYVWFTVDGVGADPAPGGIGILVPVLSSTSVGEATLFICTAMAGSQSSKISCIDASLMTGGAYFTFHCNGDLYAVWYMIAGVGSAPAIAGRTIKVTLNGTETADQVASTTVSAINRLKFAVPDAKAVFKRSLNIGQLSIPDDDDQESRFSISNDLTDSAHHLGSYQYGQIIEHLHTYDKTTSITSISGSDYSIIRRAGADQPNFTTTNTSDYGGVEVRPFNLYVNTVIRY